MKKINLLLCSLLALSLLGCTKNRVTTNNDNELYKNSPASLIPAELTQGLWFYGTISAISYFDRDGHQLGNDHEAGREYQFSNVDGKGRLKFYQYLGTRTSSSCVTEYFTYKEGSVVFEDDKFTFYPLKGNFKTIKKGCSASNGVTERKAEGEDLKPITYRWELRTVENETYLYSFLEEDVNHEDPVFVYNFSS